MVSFVFLSLLSLGALSYIFINDSVEKSLEEHAMLASILARDVEQTLESNISRLVDTYISGAVNFEDDDTGPERDALKTVYRYSMFSDGVFIVNRHGDVVVTYPYRSGDMVNARSVPAIEGALFAGKVIVSDVYTDSRTRRKFIYAVAPLKDPGGIVIGAVGGRIDPTNYVFSQVIRSASVVEGTVIELVDSRGAVIASNQMDRVLTMSDHNKFMGRLINTGKPDIVRCHRCHTGKDGDSGRSADILAFSPVRLAPWGVAVRTPEEAVMGPTSNMLWATLTIGAVLVVFAVVLAAILSRSIALPISQLTNTTRMIALGELDSPVDFRGDCEVGVLADSLEIMRQKLRSFVDDSKRYSRRLESEVAERTEELTERKAQLGALLDELLDTQEEERKRIARELHDETAQTVAVLGMSIEMALQALMEGQLEPAMLMDLRSRVGLLLDDIGRIIKDLRPPVLDDLGLESALGWFMDRYMRGRAIGYYLDVHGIEPGTFDKSSELRVFRMVQEALVNTARHSDATHVSVHIKRKGDEVDIEVVDNGVGFDVDRAAAPEKDDYDGGFGLLGIRERVEQMGGVIEIISAPGEGTGIYITVPVSETLPEVANAKD